MVAIEIPLFPLGVVLFPHMPLSLHIFEQRYRVMMRDCERNRTGFGVVAIREGGEVGRPPRPYAVGTLARLRDVERLDDGRYDLVVAGASRFRVIAAAPPRPYMVGVVEYLSDTTGRSPSVSGLVSRVATAFRAYTAVLRRLGGHAESCMDLPDDPELLSYLVAASMQVEIVHKQTLLETDSAEERLRGCLRLLRREAVLLDRHLVRRDARISLPLN